MGAWRPATMALSASGALDTDINDYNITPKDAENGPGQDHMVTIALPSGFTCKSDTTYNDATREKRRDPTGDREQ